MTPSFLGAVEFPVTVAFADGETRLFVTEVDAEMALERFDSNDPDEGVRVTDAPGRGVELVVEALSIRVLRLVP